MTADAEVPDALHEWRERSTIEEVADRPPRRAVVTVHVLAAVFVGAAVTLAARSPVPSPVVVGELVALLALYVYAFRFEFEASAGSMVPTQPVLVAMLLVGPVELVPLLVLAGILLGGIGDGSPGRGWYGLSARVISAWHSLGPVLVLLAFGVRSPTWADAGVLALALVAQFAVDAGAATARMASLGVDVRALVRPLSWTFRVDTLMAALGAGLVLSAADAPAWVRVALAGVPVVLVRMLGRDRSHHVQEARELGAAFEVVSTEASQDAMTGLGNRRRWERAVEEATAQRDAEPGLGVVVLAADLDGLKHANDTYGHETGDRLIIEFAELLVAAVPPTAVTARLGGDEFAVLMTGATAHEAQDAVDRIRTAVEAHLAVGGARLAASLGWAACPPHRSVQEAVTAADDAAGVDKRERRAQRRVEPTQT